jgi:hypothetical protein
MKTAPDVARRSGGGISAPCVYSLRRALSLDSVDGCTPSKDARNSFGISKPQQRVFHSHGWAAGPCETHNPNDLFRCRCFFRVTYVDFWAISGGTPIQIVGEASRLHQQSGTVAQRASDKVRGTCCDKNVIVRCSEQVRFDQNASDLSSGKQFRNQVKSNIFKTREHTWVIFKTGGTGRHSIRIGTRRQLRRNKLSTKQTRANRTG